MTSPTSAARAHHGRAAGDLAHALAAIQSLEVSAVPVLTLPDTWTCDGRELKPCIGATDRNTWILSGGEIRPRGGASELNTWLWDGTELKPKVGAGPANTWVLRGGKIRLKCSTRLADSFTVGELPMLAVAGKLALRLY